MKALLVTVLTFAPLFGQVPNPTQRMQPQPDKQLPMPIFRVTVVARTTPAINYHHRTGTTKIDFRGTELMPAARGQADVSSQMGSTKIETRLDHMSAPMQFGPEYMTYVLWGITPEGRPMNLGEVVLEGDHAKLLSTTDLQTFGLIVTAEPYFAVTQPSDVVVAENFIRNDTTGTMEHVDAKYELLQRGQYVLNRSQYKPPRFDPKGPLQLAEAENAVEIARLAGAQKYAGDTFQKALVDLRNAEDFLSGKSKDRKAAETNAREAAQMAEDARIITFRKMHQEQLDAERAASEKREADAQEHARQEALKAQQSAEQARLDQQRRLEAENQQRAADQARMQAEQAKADADRARLAAEQAAAQATQEKAAADAAKAEAMRQQQALAAEADRARQDANRAETEKTQLRERLRQQLNMILETRETARGLIVNISDVLFDFNKYTLKPGAREKLAKVSGILLAYPGLKIQVEGHTDAIGSDEYNQTLSEQRAGAVRDYITTQGVPGNMVTAVGFGKQNPVATNDTDAGRQQNRRVELVVSGEAIGIGSLQ